MKSTSNKLSSAVRYALYAGATAAVGLSAAPVFAQDVADQPDSAQLETIVVTGSRIRSADVETAQPIVVIDRAQIEKEGYTSVADILQNLTVAGSPPISRASALASGEDVGGYYVDLRNLGNNRTLVLLNGHRLGATTSGAQDLSQVPTSAIERIEVLKDGASAIYGSDAIAGVVNIITRSRFEGAEANAYYGEFSQGDGATQMYDMTMGATSDRGSITFTAQYNQSDPVYAADRRFSRDPNGPKHPFGTPGGGGSYATNLGAFFFPSGSCPGQDDSPLGACTLNPGGNPFDLNDYHGTSPSDRVNYIDQMYLQTGLETHSLFVNGEYQITDNISFRTNLLYNKRTTQQQIAGYPWQPAFKVPGQDNGPYIGLSPDSYYNPLGQGNGGTIYFYRRGWEQPRRTRSELSTYRFDGTFEGQFDIGDRSFNWDVGGFVNTNDLVKTQRGDFALLATQTALGPSFLDPSTGNVTCGTADAPLPYGSAPGSCVPWNPFYPYGDVGPDSLTGNDALQTFLFPEYHDTGRTKTVDYTANITGPIFTLPAGDLQFAAGYEYRQESGRYVPDAISQSALSTNLSAGPTGGRYSLDEYYLELDIPILKDLPFAQQLNVDIAGRYTRPSTFETTTNGKFSVKWKPIDDLLVRGNYANGFRAPTIADLYGGLSGTFPFYTDPCGTTGPAAGASAEVRARCTNGFGGQAPVPADYVQIGQATQACATFPCQTGVQWLSGANPNLGAETSTSKTVGFVYSPRFVDGLDVSLDWWSYHIKNAIQGDTSQDSLNDCYLSGIAARCASSLFTRDPATGIVNYSLSGLANKGYVKTEGYDFGVNYRLPEFSFGSFGVAWNTTYVSNYTVKPTNDADAIVSQYNSFAGGYFRIRSSLQLDWTLGDWGATWTTQYYSAQKEGCSYADECNDPEYQAPDTGGISPTNVFGANTFHNLQVRWNAPWNATISGGLNNVFNHAGPVMYSQPNSSFNYYGGYPIGRFWYMQYKQKF